MLNKPFMPEQKATGIHLLYPEACKFPVNPIRVANALGYRVCRDDNAVDGYFNLGKKTIFFNTNMSVKKKRFTVAHELGHAVLNHSKEEMETRQGEAEANLFAECLLAPSDIVHRCINNGYDFIQMTEFFGVGDYFKAFRLERMGIISNRWRKI